MQNAIKGIILPSSNAEVFKPLTYQMPVGMLPVVNKPIIEHQVELFVRNGIKDISISCNHLSNKVQAYFEDGSRWGATTSYNFERPPFGLVAALRHMRPYLEGGTLVIILSNIIADIDLREALEFHWAKRADATFLYMDSETPQHGLSIVVDDNDRVSAVGTQSHNPLKCLPIEAGVCIIEPETLDLLSDTLGHNLLQACWVASQRVRLHLFGYPVDGPLTKITGWESYTQVQKDILSGKYPGVVVPGIELQPGVWVGKNISASSGVSFEPPLLIGDNCRIGKGVSLGKETIIGHDVMVDVGASLQNAIIMSNTFVGPQTLIRDAIIQGNLMIDLTKKTFTAIEDRLAAFEIAHAKTGFRFYILLNRWAAALFCLLLSPIFLLLFTLLILGLKFPLLTRVRRLAPDLRELAAGKLRLRVFDLIYIGPADLTKRPVGYNPDPLTALPHVIARLGNLFNVIKGDIMLVGNRPADPEIAFSFTEEYRRTRLKCQAGVISILDTNEVDDTTEEEQIISEGYYAVNRNFWMDLGILIKGLWRLFWRMVGVKKVVREYKPVPPEESPSFE
jgi:NDP-sugar pyrophosphorylase family protein